MKQNVEALVSKIITFLFPHPKEIHTTILPLQNIKQTYIGNN